MFASSKVSQSMIDAVNKVLGENQSESKETVQPVVQQTPTGEVQQLDEAVKETTPTGVKVFGSSYGNSAKAKQDQTKSSIDKLKGPKDKEMKEELKGNQDRIDANHNNKIDGQDFKILRGKKKVKEETTFASKLIEKVRNTIAEKKDVVMPEEVRKSDVPAYLRKAKGDTPLTVADAKGPKKDTISAPENLAKARNEEVELDEQINEVLSKDASAGDWIHDFVHSDNPKFSGKSTAERKKMALGAYYGAQKESYLPADTAITTDTLAGRGTGGKSNSFQSFKSRVKPLDKEGNGNPEKVSQQDPEETKSRTSIKAKPTNNLAPQKVNNLDPKFGKTPGFSEEVEVDEATIAGTSGWKEMPKNVTDKSGAVHTPMSRAKSLAKDAFKAVQNRTKIKSK